MLNLHSTLTMLTGWKRALAAVFCGAIAALALPPYDLFFVGWLSFPVLVWLLDGIKLQPSRQLKQSFLTGWWFGLGYFVSGLWWIGNALFVDADMFAWAIPLAVLGLPSVLAVFYGLATMLTSLVPAQGFLRIVALATSFAFAEWLRSFVLTGFPWNSIGQTIMPTPVAMQSITIFGVNGMNMLAVLIFAMPAILFDKRQRIAGAALACLLAAFHIGFGVTRLYVAPESSETLLNVRIVQPSIDQTEKWDAQVRDRIFRTYLDMSLQPSRDEAFHPDLIIWPETSVPFILSQRPDAISSFADLLDEGQTLLAGAVRVEKDDQDSRYYNSVTAINSQGIIYDAVDKMWLVPFGEYLPFGEILSKFGLQRIVESVSDFSAAKSRHAIQLPNGSKALPYICYEIIFSDKNNFKEYSADFIINVTNDAWFGNSPGPYQHFRQAQIRAVEAGIPVIRAANNGISGVIDKYGRITASLQIDEIGILDTTITK